MRYLERRSAAKRPARPVAERRSRRTGRLAVVAVALVLGGLRSARAEVPADTAHQRADAALASLLTKYWSRTLDYLRDVYQGTAETSYGGFASGLDAVLDGAERTEGRRFGGLIRTLFESQSRRGWTAERYDEESAMALALLRAHELTGSQDYLEVAGELFNDIRAAWDGTGSGGSAGGIWSDREHTQKTTAANARAVILGTRFSRRTGDGGAGLEFARVVYEHWLATMVDPVSFEVADSVGPDGVVRVTGRTCNEALMIGAGVELYRATGDSRYLDISRSIAGFLLENGVAGTEFGPVLHDGDPASCESECHACKGVACRHLADLYRETGDLACLGALRASAEAVWNRARVASGNLFGVDWTAAPVEPAFSEQQMAAASTALDVAARLSGPYPAAVDPSRLEAEDATIRGVGLEAKFGVFSGWGYVAGWQGEGQSVDFRVHVPKPGLTRIEYRYSAEASPAVREIRIDGEPFLNVYFERTGSWRTFATTVHELEMEAGDVVLTIAYEAAFSSYGYVNLDYIAVSAIPIFRRGDANVDGTIDVSDAASILRFLFLGDPRVMPCEKSADSDDEGSIDITDAIYLLGYLFLGGPNVPLPHACGVDEVADVLDCASFPPCE